MRRCPKSWLLMPLALLSVLPLALPSALVSIAAKLITAYLNLAFSFWTAPALIVNNNSVHCNKEKDKITRYRATHLNI